MLLIDPQGGARSPGEAAQPDSVWLGCTESGGDLQTGQQAGNLTEASGAKTKKKEKKPKHVAKLPPVPSEFSFKLPEESWWLPTQPPMDVSAEQPGLGSSPPGPQLQLHPQSPPFSFFFLTPSPSPFLPSRLPSSFQAAGIIIVRVCGEKDRGIHHKVAECWERAGGEDQRRSALFQKTCLLFSGTITDDEAGREYAQVMH